MKRGITEAYKTTRVRGLGSGLSSTAETNTNDASKKTGKIGT